MWHVGSYFRDQGSNLCPLQWKYGVLCHSLDRQGSPTSVSWLLRIMLLWILVCNSLVEILFSVVLNINLEVGLLDLIVILFWIFWGPPLPFSTLVVPFYMLISSAQGEGSNFFMSLPTLYFFCVRTALMGMRWYLTVICIALMISKFGKLSSGHRTGKDQFSFQFQRKAMPKNAQTTAQLHSSHTLVK